MLFLCPQGHTRKTSYLGICYRCNQNKQKMLNCQIEKENAVKDFIILADHFEMEKSSILWLGKNK